MKQRRSIDWPAVAARLKALRVAHGYSATAFAQRVGLSKQRWLNYETGRRKLSGIRAAALCTALNVSMDYLFLGRVIHGRPPRNSDR